MKLIRYFIKQHRLIQENKSLKKEIKYYKENYIHLIHYSGLCHELEGLKQIIHSQRIPLDDTFATKLLRTTEA